VPSKSDVPLGKHWRCRPDGYIKQLLLRQAVEECREPNQLLGVLLCAFRMVANCIGKTVVYAIQASGVWVPGYSTGTQFRFVPRYSTGTQNTQKHCLSKMENCDNTAQEIVTHSTCNESFLQTTSVVDSICHEISRALISNPLQALISNPLQDSISSLY
jgi:hypothetical protein